MLRRSLALLAVAGLTGCAASVEPVGFGNRDRTGQAQMAAYAASEQNQYPRNLDASTDRALAAVVNHDRNTIRIYNYSGEVLTDAKLWVNQAFIHRLDSIPANSSVTISFSGLYDNTGKTFAAAKAPITSVEIQAGDNLYTVLGPAYE